MRLLKTALIWTALLSAAFGRTIEPNPKHLRIARDVARILPREHLIRQRLDDQMSRRAWSNYIAALDYNRLYFRQDDIREFSAQMTELDDQLKNGDVRFAYEVFNTYLLRVSNRCDYVAELLDRGFDLERDETYRWRRHEAPWVGSQQEWNELWRRHVKNEYVRYRVGQEIGNEQRESPESEEDTAATNNVPTPEASIREQYEQLRIILEDSGAESVLERYLAAFARAYDPHSDYMSPSSEDDFNIEMKLSLVGIGALLEPEDGAAKIVRLIPGGPASRDNRDIRLRPGDKIIAVGQGDDPPINILHWPLSKVVKLIRGEKNTRVVLTVIPAADPTGTTTRRVDIVRDEVKLEEQAARGEVIELAAAATNASPRKVGVITVPAFYRNMDARSRWDREFRSSTDDVAGIVNELVGKGVDGLVLDLRRNGGGSLQEAVAMTGLFIDQGVVVLVKERFGISELEDEQGGMLYDGPLVVLISRLSASASEILAGALQDYGRAIVVGDSKTHGKGSVQEVIPVSHRERLGALKLTRWQFYRINGSSTQVKGVAADIEVPTPFDTMELGEEYLDFALPWSSVRASSYTPFSDLQPLLPGLRALSMQRQREEGRFKAYRSQLDLLRNVNHSETWPLSLSARRRLAASEKELADLQDRLADQVRGVDEGEGERRDLVLTEAARILSDLARWWPRIQRQRKATGQLDEPAINGARVEPEEPGYRWMPEALPIRVGMAALAFGVGALVFSLWGRR